MNSTKRLVLMIVTLATIGTACAGMLSSPAYARPVPDDDGSGAPATTQDSPCQAGDACENFINKYINPFIKLLTVSIGVFATISIVIAGVQYASAGSDPSQIQKAKQRIFQTLLGLLAYIFLFAFLNYIIPGGFLR